jgi:hypothetical protein
VETFAAEAPAWQRAVARWRHAAVFTDDLLRDVRSLSRTVRVFGVRPNADALRSLAQRALECDDHETRAVAAQLLAELERLANDPPRGGAKRARRTSSRLRN